MSRIESLSADKNIRFAHNNLRKVIYYQKDVTDTLLIFDESHQILYRIFSKKIIRREVKKISILDNLIAINLFNKTLIFKKVNNSVIFDFEINHKYEYGLFIDTTRIFFKRNYNYHPFQVKPEERTMLSIYNITEKKFVNERKIDFQYILYTHFISDFVALSPTSNLIAVAQSKPYKVVFYNSSLEVIDSIQNNSLNNNLSELDSLHKKNTFFNNSVKSSIRDLSNLDANIDRIFKIYYLNDTTLIVLKKMSKSIKMIKREILMFG